MALLKFNDTFIKSPAGVLLKSGGVQIDGDPLTLQDHTYSTVQIGSQLWTVQNLDEKLDGIDIAPSGVHTTPSAWYYSNDETTHGWSGRQNGLFYNWYCVSVINTYLNANANGWRVPTNADFNTLISTVGGAYVAMKVLKSTSSYWNSSQVVNGTDAYGFNTLPAGGRFNVGNFDNLNRCSYFWTATEDSSSLGNVYTLQYNEDYFRNFTIAKIRGYSIRLVKDL